MWLKALNVIPRLSRDEWNELDIISRFLVASRAAVFIMTALAAGIGGLLAWRDGFFSWKHFLACMFGLISAHAANNLINDLTDHYKGVDKDNYYRSLYGPQALEHGLLTLRGMLAYIAFACVCALACGIYASMAGGPGTWVLITAGAFFILFYTWPLKYIGLGEPAVIVVWGPLMIGGTYYVLSGGQWTTEVLLISLVYSLGPAGVLFGKHIDKLKEDKAKGIHTLPVLLGERNARFFCISLWIVQFILIGYLIFSGITGYAMAIVLPALPKLIWAVKVFNKPRPDSAPADLPAGVWPLYLSAMAFIYNKRFGILFLLGLIIDSLIPG